MKYFYLPIFLVCALSLQAQISLPYYNSFTTQDDLDDWVEYRTGQTPDSFSTWNFWNGQLTHYYPVGGQLPTNDWMVSEAIDLSNGGTIDSIRFRANGFGTPFGIDTVALYVLDGNRNPLNANAQILVHLFSDSTYQNDDVWRTFSNIHLPAVSSSAYIAFRYQTTVNWLDVFFDDLSVSAIPASITSADIHTLKVYPSLIRSEEPLQVSFDFNIDEARITDLSGIEKTVHLHNNTLSTKDLEPGIHFITIEHENELYRQRFVVVR